LGYGQHSLDESSVASHSCADNTPSGIEQAAQKWWDSITPEEAGSLCYKYGISSTPPSDCQIEDMYEIEHSEETPPQPYAGAVGNSIELLSKAVIMLQSLKEQTITERKDAAADCSIIFIDNARMLLNRIVAAQVSDTTKMPQGTEPSQPKPSTAPTQIEEVAVGFAEWLQKFGSYWTAEENPRRCWIYEETIGYTAKDMFKIYLNQGTGSSEAGTERSKDAQSEIQTPVTQKPLCNLAQSMAYGEEQDYQKSTASQVQNTPPCSEQMQGWISVEDRLPENSGEVLIWLKTHSVYVAHYKKHRKLFTVYGLGGQEITDLETTHWQPLPEAPKQ
jgi:hypothetical protein